MAVLKLSESGYLIHLKNKWWSVSEDKKCKVGTNIKFITTNFLLLIISQIFGIRHPRCINLLLYYAYIDYITLFSIYLIPYSIYNSTFLGFRVLSHEALCLDTRGDRTHTFGG